MIRKARPEDIDRIMESIEEARRFQLSYGNDQWASGYPSRELIEEDVETGIGWCILSDSCVAGYLAVVDHDDAYDRIEGKWLTDGPYLAAHRIAILDEFRGRGLFPILISDLEALCKERGIPSLRMDTDRKNPIMQHLLPKLGFTFTGYVFFDNDAKPAYEKILH